MKQFLRDNPTITFGLGLPVLLVVVFLLISGIPTLLVPPPQYDVLYVTSNNNLQYGVQISVVKNKVQVVYQGDVLNGQKPQIWRYHAQTGAIQEIPFLLPPGLKPPGNYLPENRPDSSVNATKITLIEVPELEGLTIDSSSIAPDGYEFIGGPDSYSRNIFDDMFFSTRYRHDLVLKKDGRSVRLPNTGARYYWGNAKFIGWVVQS